MSCFHIGQALAVWADEARLAAFGRCSFSSCCAGGSLPQRTQRSRALSSHHGTWCGSPPLPLSSLTTPYARAARGGEPPLARSTTCSPRHLPTPASPTSSLHLSLGPRSLPSLRLCCRPSGTTPPTLSSPSTFTRPHRLRRPRPRRLAPDSLLRAPALMPGTHDKAHSRITRPRTPAVQCYLPPPQRSPPSRADEYCVHVLRQLRAAPNG